MSLTTNYSFTKPTVGADQDAWGGYLNADLDSIDSILFGKFDKAGGTMTGTVTFAAGSTTVAPAKFQAGALLTTPVAHAHEWDGTNLYVTDSTPTRKQLAYSTDTYAGTLTSTQVTTALGYTPPTPTGTGASGTWGISISGVAASASAVAVGGITGLGTGVATALAVNVGSAGALVANGGALGTPSSGNLANCTFPTLNQNTTGTASNITGTYAGTITASQVNAGLGYTAGYINVPGNTQSSAYVAVAGDVGKCIKISTCGVTINAGVHAVDDAFTIYNNSASSQTITQGTSVTLRLVGTATTGNRTLAQRGLAYVQCVASNEFLISGGGVS